MAIITYEVIGELPVVDCVSNKSCVKGEPVQLDDELTNIDALLQGGLIQPQPTKKTSK